MSGELADAEGFERVVATHVQGSFYCARHILLDTVELQPNVPQKTDGDPQ